MRKVEYELMTVGEILEAKREASLVFVPVSPIEWHGPHLPMGTDGLHARHVAVRVAREVGGVVLPTLFLGTETVRPSGAGSERLAALGLDDDARVVGMDFPGFPVKSLYLEESAFGIAVRDLVRALVADSFRRGRARQRPRRHQPHAYARSDRPRGDTPGRGDGAEPDGLDPCSPAELRTLATPTVEETAIMLAIAGEHVRLDELPRRHSLRYADYGIVEGPAFDGSPTSDFTVPPQADPRSATREQGEQILEREVQAAAVRVQAELARW